ncbi:g11002 [Coccomyxa elongata]
MPAMHSRTPRDPVAAYKRQFSSITSKKTFYRGIYIIRPASPGSLQIGQPRERSGALKCAASSGSTVRLTTQHEVAFGEVIKVVGTQEELGAWDPVAAPGLTWSDGNKWSVDLQLPPGSYEFKLVVVREDGTPAEWEAGPNREIMVDEAKDDVIEAECTWSNTTATLVTNAPRTIPLESETDEAADIVHKAETPAEASGAVAQVEAAEAEAESSGMTLSEAEPQLPAADTSPANQASEAPEGSEPVMPGDAEKPVGEAQQDDAENALEAVTEPEGELEEPTPSLDTETPTVPGGADEWGPAGGGEMGSVDEADVEKQERSEVQERWADNIVQAESNSDGPAEPEAATTDATPQQATEAPPAPDSASASAAEEGEGTGGVLKVEAEGSSVAEAAASPTAAVQFQPDPTPEQIASGTLEVAAEGTKVADAAGGSVAQAVFKTDASPGGTESGGPPVGLQVFVGTLALFAVPVVAWSLYTLSMTGCGLPPGPGGALGALEGVSYITLLGVCAWSIGMKATTSKGLPPGPGGLLGAAEGLSYLSLAAGAVVLVLQVKNYGYVPSALPDARCFGDSGPKSHSDITKALADAFASASRDAPPLSNSLQDDGTSARPAASSDADSAASSSGTAALEAGTQVLPQPPPAVPHQGVDALFEILDS